MDRDEFLRGLEAYHLERGHAFTPGRLLGQKVDLYEMFVTAMRQGGFPRINKNNKWGFLAKHLRLVPKDKPPSAQDLEQVRSVSMSLKSLLLLLLLQPAPKRPTACMDTCVLLQEEHLLHAGMHVCCSWNVHCMHPEKTCCMRRHCALGRVCFSLHARARRTAAARVQGVATACACRRVHVRLYIDSSSRHVYRDDVGSRCIYASVPCACISGHM